MQMNKSNKICAIGENNNISIFKGIGVDTLVSDDIEEIDKYIFNMVKVGCKIVYISEKLYSKITEILDKYKHKPFPVVIPIPINEEVEGVGMEKVRKNVEKAIGFDIF